jgi:hypothetical protein
VGGGLSEVETGVGGGVEWVVEEVVSSRGTEICDEPDHKAGGEGGAHTTGTRRQQPRARVRSIFSARGLRWGKQHCSRASHR